MNSSTVNQSIVEHWDGTSWSVVPNEHPGGFHELTGIAAVSSADVWAVGSGTTQPLIEHWNGTSWSIVPSPAVSGRLTALAVFSASDVWAVGYATGGVTLIENWDGGT